MKRLLTLSLALFITISLVACNTPPTETPTGTGTPQSAEITSAAATTLTTAATAAPAEITEAVATTEPAVMLTMDDATEVHTADLSDGYRLEVGKLGEKSGIVRLTDPNLQDSYPATDPSFSEDRIIHRWEVSLTDTYSLAIYHSNKNEDGKETVSLEDMIATVIKIEGDRGMWIEPMLTKTDGKTITMQFEIPDEENFKWSDVTEYHIVIEDDPLDTLIAKDIFAADMQSNKTETTTTVTTTNVTTTTAAVNEMGVAEAITEMTAAPVTTTTTTTTTAKNEPAICGSYRSVEPAYPMTDAELEELKATGEDFMIYDYINIEQHKDGSFQVEFRFQIGGSGNDFASFDTEALGTADWYSFYFDGDMGVPYNNGPVTITSDGTTAWVTFDGGEPQEFRKTE
jgi:hypothetical protein